MLANRQHIGMLDRRVTFQAAIIGDDVSNADVETGWEDISTTPEVFAEVDERGGRESQDADKLVTIRTLKFTIRYRTDLNEKMRILYDGSYYDIYSILKGSRKGYLEIIGVKGTDYQETTT